MGNPIRRQLDEMEDGELLELIQDAADQLRRRRSQGSKRGRLTEIFGLGEEVWEGLDPVRYLRGERDAWE